MSSPAAVPARPAPFFEAAAWRHVGPGWQRVFGSFKGVGYSVEWHDFAAPREIDWGASFHPRCVELCLNLRGRGHVIASDTRAEFADGNAGFYCRHDSPVEAKRAAGDRHQFLTIEYSHEFLARHLAGTESKLHAIVRTAIEGNTSAPAVSRVDKLAVEQEQIMASLRQPPVYAAAHALWYQCKALELAVAFFYQPAPEEEFFCTRQQRLAHERAEQVVFLLKQNLASPPGLEDMARSIGCSPFHLSRVFSTHTGQTIPQCLRRLRMEKAAEMLRSKEYNVTEVALEVGYNSLSHFSQAFYETYGCCPGLYPLATPAQRALPAHGKARK
ncbi:MAG: helix-turn-helix transcriptional regulator [Verrucomicrobiota bacterium]